MSGLRKGISGFTLIEVIITITIAGILASLAAPSFSALIEKRRTIAGAEEIAAFMMLARSEAVKHNQQVTVRVVRDDNTNWCLGMMFGAGACDCENETVADADYCALKYTDSGGNNVVEPQRISSADYSDISLTAVSTGSGGDTALTYDPVRGILANLDDIGSLTIQSDSGSYELGVSVSPTGTVKVCTNADKKIPGFKSCS